MLLRARDRVLAGTPLVAGLVALPDLVGFGAPAVRATASWGAVLAFQVAMSVFAFRAAWRVPRGDPARRFWAAFGTGGAIYALGDLAHLGLVMAGPATVAVRSGTEPVRTAALGLGTAVIMAVVLTYPLRLRTRRERMRFPLDLATVMVAAGAYGLYLTVPGTHGLAGNVLDVLAGPIVTLLAAFAVGRVLMAGSAPFTWLTGVLGAVAASVEAAARGLGPALVRDGRTGVLLALAVTSHALLMMSARVQYRHGPRVPDDRPSGAYSRLPYLAIAATYLLLTVTLARHGLDLRAWIVLGGAAASTGLVVIRQLLAFADNARLVAQLDANVRELHATDEVLRAALAERDALATRLRAMAFSDSLTGLANRALFDERLGAALASPGDQGRGPGVLLVDLDDFKPVNDRFGHAAGDAVLVEVANRLRRCVRPADLVARLGGDEFAVLLDGASTGDCVAAGERIVAAMAGNFPVAGADIRIRASVGVAVRAPADGTPDALLGRADTAMYAAKARGKNAVAVAGR